MMYSRLQENDPKRGRSPVNASDDRRPGEVNGGEEASSELKLQ